MIINEILNKNAKGLYYGNRIILPFKAHFLKIIVDDEIYTDFSPGSKVLSIVEQDLFTDIYFREIDDLKDEVSGYESIKMVAVEKGEDIFDFKNHIKIAIYLEDNHQVKLEKTDEDILFIE